jgi:formylglycine-generating enzyme required for sulfatase activity
MSRIAALALLLTITSHASSVEPPKKSAEPLKEFANSIGMKFKLIPAGEFLMGAPESDSLHFAMPQHKVRITKPFYLGMFEVTQAEYEKVMGKNPSKFSKTGFFADILKGMDTSSFPVETVSWDDAVEFCKRLSAKEGQTYRLPTEAEWEHACRAGSPTRYCFGDDGSRLVEYAWFKANSDEHTHPVGQKKPNAWGLHDMHGNVWEWCNDWYGEDYHAKSPKDDPPGPATGSTRVFRGGSWYNAAGRCQSKDRFVNYPTNRTSVLGFRVARSPSGK